MGIWLYVFNHKEWEHWYKDNCSAKTVTEWNAEGEPNIPIGIVYITIGVLCEIFYIPFMIVMARKEFIQHSCYKFMFLMGIIDMFVLPFNAIAGGIQAILGYHYCAYPILYFFIGVIPSSGWYGTGMTCLLLAINRFFEMTNHEIAKKLFGGRRIYIWLSLPFVYMFYTFFEEVATYQNKYFAFFFDPFYGEPGWESAKHVNLTYHCIHNITIVIGLGGIYGLLCFIIATKSTSLFKNADTSKVQKLMTLQSMCICIEIFIAAIVYVIMQFYTLPDILIVIAHACWICVHGDTPIVYFFINESLRKAVIKLVSEFCGFRISLRISRTSRISTVDENTHHGRHQSGVNPITLTAGSSAVHPVLPAIGSQNP